MIVFPMAGESRRFKDAGYASHKFMLPLQDVPLFDWVVEPFFREDPNREMVFVVADKESEEFVSERCQRFELTDYHVLNLGRGTSGQAETVYLALGMLPESAAKPLFVYNIDTIRKSFTTEVDPDAAGVLDLFVGPGEHWSFAEIDDNGRIVRTAEKIRISQYCSDGLYYFKDCQLFMECFSHSRVMSNGERYIAPLYNYLISEGHEVRPRIIDINELRFCGVPAEYLECQSELEKYGSFQW